MKDYFKFNLTGKKLLPIWLLFLVLFVVPYCYVQYKIQGFQGHEALQQEAMQRLFSMLQWYGVMFLLLVIEYVFIFFIAKMSIENIEFKEKTFLFKGKFGEFFGVFILGLFLSIITIGIYSPWFVKNMYNYFAKNSSYNSNEFEFKGKGGELFLIILFTLIIPMIFIMGGFFIFAFTFAISGVQNSELFKSSISIITMVVIFILMIPYMYYIYKWMVDVKYKNYTIKWETSFWNSSAKIALEILLSIITIGIYLPLASLKLYQYFAERTVAKSEVNSKKFGYDIEPWHDFLFIWGQVLLTIITLGVYYSWAYCKITNRILSKTYTEEIEIV